MPSGRLTLRCDCTPVHEARCDLDGAEALATAIVDAVAEVSDADPLDLEPLARTLDGDALESLFARRDGGSDLVLSFTLDGWNVFVRGDGRIRVCDPAGSGDASPVFA